MIREEVSPYRRPKEKTPEPGSYSNHLIPFGQGKMSNVTMGSKYEFKPDRNPPVGGYNIDSGLNASKRRARSAHIKEPTSSFRRPTENLPEPGSYDNHLTPFAKGNMPNITMGSKYEFKPDRNPPVGAYDIDKGIKASSPNSRSATIREEVYPYRRPKERSPDPGIYDGHLSIFGADVSANIGMGSKYIFKPDSNPAVG